MLQTKPNPRGPINLAHVPPFRLGEVEVYPSTRQIVRRERQETLEPRVMQVLVALAEVDGAVLTRDDLIDRCWDGRIVGENAINRVISRIRQVAAEFGMGSFQLETITKVGYRLIVRGPNGSPAPQTTEGRQSPGEARPDPSRRFLLGGALAVAAAGAGGLWFWSTRSRHEPPAAALEFFRRGEIAQRQGLPDQTRQAVSFFKQAVTVDPEFGRGWGALALSYRHILEGFGASVEGDLPDLIRSAARRALALDPDNADAQLALAIIKPYYRNWARLEAELRQLAARFPDHWLLQAQLGLLLQDVGRLDEGVEHSRRVLAIDRFVPLTYAFLSRGLSCAGRIQEAEAVLSQALEQWPAHPAIWNSRINFLLFNGRAASAAAFIMDPATRPEGMTAEAVASRLQLARAVELRRPEDVEASLAANRVQALADVQAIPGSAVVFALLGRPELAFDSLERYFFGTGRFGDPIPPPGPVDRRYTIAFFSPPMRPYRDHARYRELLERVGLERYWRDTKTMPDFRRG